MTIFEELQAAGLPVISADESGSISMGYMTPQQKQQFDDIVLNHFDPTAYQNVLQQRTDLQALKDAYQDMITRLEQIQNAGVVPFTQTGFNQVVQAVKDESLYVERIMKFLKRLLNS